MIGKVRPQILAAIICATIISLYGLWVGMTMGATEVITAIVGGIFGFLGCVALKVLENE